MEHLQFGIWRGRALPEMHARPENANGKFSVAAVDGTVRLTVGYRETKRAAAIELDITLVFPFEGA